MGQIYGWLASSGSGSSVAKTGDTMTGKLQYSGTNHAGIRLNNLTTTQQNALTGAAGDTVWNSTLAAVGVYDGSVWQQQAVLGLAQTFTAAQTIKRDGIGSTSTDGFLLRNTTAAAAGAQQYSPRWVLEGQGWKTTATAASQAVSFMAEVRPVQGAANPSGTWALASSINGGAYSDVLTVTSAGAIGISSGSASAPSIYWTSAGAGYGLSYDSNSAGLAISTNGISAAVIGAGNANIPTIIVPVTGGIGWSSNSNANSTSVNLALKCDAANTLGLRNGTSAQTFNAYGTFTDTGNYRRVALAMTTAGVATLKPEGAGTGASGNVLHISGLPTSNPGPGILWNNAGSPAIGT